MQHTSPPTNAYAKDWTLALALGLLCGLALPIASTLEPKWFYFTTVSLLAAAATGLFVLPERAKILLYLAVFLAGIKIDAHFMHHPLAFETRPIWGIKVHVFDIPFLVAIVLWLTQKIKNPDMRIRMYAWFTIPMALIWVLMLASSLNAEGIPSITRFSMLWLLFKDWLIVIYLANNIRDAKTLFIVIALILASGVLHSLVGVLQYGAGSSLGLDLLGENESTLFNMRVGGGTVSRVGGLTGHPNNLAFFLAGLLLINLSLILSPLKWRIKKYAIACFCLLSLGELLTFSRGGWINLGVGGLVLTWWVFARWTKQKILSIALVVILVVAVAASAIIAVEPIRRRLIEDDHGAAQIRIPLMQVAFNMIRTHPWLGVGPGNSRVVSHQYDDTREAVTWTFPAYVHNEFLLIAADLGLPAVFLFLFIMLVVMLRLWRATRFHAGGPLVFLAMGLFAAWVGWFFNLQVRPAQVMFWHLPTWVLIGISVALSDPDNPVHEPPAAQQPAPAA